MGPRSFSGPIGKLLPNCEKMTLASYEPIISENIPKGDYMNDLSCDQKYLLNIFEAVKRGHCDDDLSYKVPGNISHARWLTTANRILRLYVSTVHPSDQLLKLVKFIMQVYIPSWFQIKRCNSIINGPKNMHSMILRCQGQEEDVKNIIKPVIQRNAYFLHSENILLCMVHDEDNTMKELGWRKILKSRQNKQRIAVRSFKSPDINFEAENYHGLIDWNQDFTSPPLFHHIESSAIEKFVLTKQFPSASPGITEIPNHTQAVERHIKIVTDVSTKVCGSDRRDGAILAILESRKKMPQFENKKQYKI